MCVHVHVCVCIVCVCLCVHRNTIYANTSHTIWQSTEDIGTVTSHTEELCKL